MKVLKDKNTSFQRTRHGPVKRKFADGGVYNVETPGAWKDSAKVYLFQMQHGIILCTMGENRVLEVRDVSSMEIWRYLYAPSKVIESIASMLITVAEKHRSIKGEWMSSFGRIIGLSHDDKNKASEWPADQRFEDPSS